VKLGLKSGSAALAARNLSSPRV